MCFGNWKMSKAYNITIIIYIISMKQSRFNILKLF